MSGKRHKKELWLDPVSYTHLKGFNSLSVIKERTIKKPHWKNLKSHFRNSGYGMRS